MYFPGFLFLFFFIHKNALHSKYNYHMVMATMAPCLGMDCIDSCKYNYHMIMATMAPCLGTDCIDSCKYNYHMIMATMAPCLSCVKHSYV
jgi:hypothetical protein